MKRRIRRHLTRDEIIAECKQIARESRMSSTSPWSAMGIMCGYVMLRQEGFKQKRITNVAFKVNEMEGKFDRGEVTLEEINQRLYDKVGWKIEWEPYTEKDIVGPKKGTYDYWIMQKQITPENNINEQAARYITFFFAVLMEEYGYGKTRLTRIQEAINNLLSDYRQDKTSTREWQKALYDEAGVVYELPIDPLTQTAGSIMTGA